MRPNQVIIIGGGIGGLCTAIALHQRGFDVTVYDKVKKLGEIGAGITLWSNAIKALRTFGIADQVIQAGSKLNHSQIRAATGETLHDARTDDMAARYGEPVVAIHRADLHNILIDALPATVIRLGTGFIKFEQDSEKVTAYFENGASDSADILIGADGIHSPVRKQLFPEVQLRYSGYTAWRGVVQTENEAALGLTSETWGAGARFGIVRVDKSRVYWFATSNQPAGEKSSGAEKKSKLLTRFNLWHAPIDHLLDSTPAEAILQNDIFDIPPFASWSTGRVILLGDSAHATTPNMGQGACMAIESAYALSRALEAEPEYRSAFERYERERHARTAWITNQSRQIGAGGQIENPFLCALRNWVIKAMPREILQSRIHIAAGFDVTKEV
jgi:2-polyprenyl-6-methoxyphenol hydroxylase-like FAD-dependent oxidoreductase